MSAPRMRETGNVRVSRLQTRLWGRSSGAICSDSYTECQELPEVSGPYAGMDSSQPPLATMGATAASVKDVAGLLSILRAAPLRAQTQLGAARGKAAVDTCPKSSRPKTPDELGSAEEPTLVRTAIRSKPAPHDLTEPIVRKCHLGSPVREICTPGSAWGDE